MGGPKTILDRRRQNALFAADNVDPCVSVLAYPPLTITIKDRFDGKRSTEPIGSEIGRLGKATVEGARRSAHRTRWERQRARHAAGIDQSRCSRSLVRI